MAGSLQIIMQCLLGTFLCIYGSILVKFTQLKAISAKAENTERYVYCPTLACSIHFVWIACIFVRSNVYYSVLVRVMLCLDIRRTWESSKYHEDFAIFNHRGSSVNKMKSGAL